MTVADAQATLLNQGLNVSESEDYSGSAIVTAQSLTGEVREGTTINITAKEPEEPKSSSAAASSSAEEEEELIEEELEEEEEEEESSSSSASSSSKGA